MSQFDDSDSENEFDPNFDEVADLERRIRELEAESARLQAQLDQVQAMARENAEETAKLRADIDDLAVRIEELRRRIHRDRWINLFAPALAMILGGLTVFMWMR
ncbi:MAG: hypothetical protein L0241_05415 [Planctomycetia bacterium]|nr:hypothetical protein [Planctomycetia bacterium]